MITEESEWTTTVTPNYVLELKRTDIVKRDGEQIAATIWRVAVAPGDDVSSYPESVQVIANAVWTPEVIQSYLDSIQTQ